MPSAISLTVYSTGPACMRCALTCRCLDDLGLTYTVIDLRDVANGAARAWITDDLGYTEAPVVVVDGNDHHHWSGFRPDLIRQLVNSDV